MQFKDIVSPHRHKEEIRVHIKLEDTRFKKKCSYSMEYTGISKVFFTSRLTPLLHDNGLKDGLGSHCGAIMYSKNEDIVPIVAQQ
jgi:hypothetical protein